MMIQSFRKMRVAHRFTTILILAAVISFGANAQDGYKKAPPEVSSILSAPVTPVAFVSPARDAMLLATSLRYPPLADLAEPMLRLAGQRINPSNNGPHRYPYFVALSLKRLSDDTEIKIALPPGAKIGAPIWSADGKRFVFTNTTPSGVELWSGEASTGAVKRIKEARVNTTSGDSVQWMPDNRMLLVLLVPSKRAPAPTAINVPR